MPPAKQRGSDVTGHCQLNIKLTLLTPTVEMSNIIPRAIYMDLHFAQASFR